MKEDYEVITSATLSVMQANVTNFRKIVINSELMIRFHGDNAELANPRGAGAMSRDPSLPRR